MSFAINAFNHEEWKRHGLGAHLRIERPIARADRTLDRLRSVATPEGLRLEVQGYGGVDGAVLLLVPLKYIDMVPTEQFGGNESWRECVRSNHAKARDKQRRRATERQTPSVSPAT